MYFDINVKSGTSLKCSEELSLRLERYVSTCSAITKQPTKLKKGDWRDFKAQITKENWEERCNLSSEILFV